MIIDAGCSGSEGNTDKLVIRDSPMYTGMKQNRVTEKSAAGTVVNSAYYGEGNFEEFFSECLSMFLMSFAFLTEYVSGESVFGTQLC